MVFNISSSANNFGVFWNSVTKATRPSQMPLWMKKLVISSLSKNNILMAQQLIRKEYQAGLFSMGEICCMYHSVPPSLNVCLPGLVPQLSKYGFQSLTITKIPKRGFKSLRSFNDFGTRSFMLKKLKTATKQDELLSNALEEYRNQPQIQRKLVESYSHGMAYAMNILKKNGFLPDTISLYLKRAILFGIAIFVFNIFYEVKTSAPVTSTSTAILRPSSSEKFEITQFVDVTFDDVKGCDEAKKELKDVVEFLRNPERFSKMGARLPKGILLSGQPGTGKTLLARAVAGEASVPFLNASGAEFDEVYVGSGAMRVRKLFMEAKSRAPCVVFIDEIDALIHHRTTSPAHPHANQTINQLLSELDGFKSSIGVIVIGATNRRDSLDPAAVRPGRFDMEIKVRPPDIFGRIALLNLYLSKVKYKDIDVESLARGTVSFTGADIANLVNQAAILACLDHNSVLTMSHLWKARDKIIYGSQSAKPQDPEVNRICAYHEAGHALVAYYSKNSKAKIHKITMIPYGESLSSVSFLPEKDNDNETLGSLLAKLDSLMGGRVAEELLLGAENVTTGPANDLQKATKIAESIVKNFAMSDSVGLRYFQNLDQTSEKSRQLIDEEVKRLLVESHARATKILTDHRTEHKLIAEALLKYETLSLQDMEDIIKGQKPKVVTSYDEEVKQKEMKSRLERSKGIRPLSDFFGGPGNSKSNKDFPPPPSSSGV